MPASWQAKRGATMAPRLAKLVVTPGTPCHFCSHPRSSHSVLVLQHSCKADGCGCPQFEPICGCGHVLSEHCWGTASKPWECAFCACSCFGANLTGTVEHRPAAEVHAALPPPPVPPKLPGPEKHVMQTENGKVAWGRRPLPMFDCASKNCPELATYWTSRTGTTGDGRAITTKAAYCGPRFRKWADKYVPDAQLSLF